MEVRRARSSAARRSTSTAASAIGPQAQTLTFSDDAPTDVASGAVFTVTFPGGDATLPSSALGGAVKIDNFVNLSNGYTVTGGTFVPGSIVSSGPITNNGTVVTGSSTLSAGNTAITFAQPGPLAPGDLNTPDVSVNVQAPPGPATITIGAATLTTTADVGAITVANPLGTPIAVTCTVPANVITTTIVAAVTDTSTRAVHDHDHCCAHHDDHDGRADYHDHGRSGDHDDRGSGHDNH